MKRKLALEQNPGGFSHSAEEWARPGLSRATRQIACAALEAMLSHADQGRLCAAERSWCERVAGEFDLAVGAASFVVRLGVRLLLWAIDLLPLLVIGRLRRMSRLELPERLRYFERLEFHRVVLFTVLFMATKVPLTLSAYEEGEPLRRTGLDRPTIGARRRRPAA